MSIEEVEAAGGSASEPWQHPQLVAAPRPRRAKSVEKHDRPRCAGHRPDGQPCRMTPGASGFCFHCDPAIPDETKQAARKKGGLQSAKQYALTAALKAGAADIEVKLDSPTEMRRLLEALARAVLIGAVPARTATALVAIVNSAAKVVEIETELALVEELERERAR